MAKMASPVTDTSVDQSTEVFSHNTWLPIAILIVLPFVMQLPFWLLGTSTDPIWFFSDVTHSSKLLPKLPYLDLNTGYTTEALGHLAASDWVHGKVPWWNPYTGIGMPLAGELQPGAFFLPFNLLLLLPEGLAWQRIVMQIIAGLAAYALLRELNMSRLASLMGGALFALNGCIAWTPGPAAVYCSAPFLPVLLWGVERARKIDQGAISILAVGAAIGWSILAGFPEPAYISGLMALAWGVYRLASAPSRWTMARRLIGGWLLGLMIAAPLLISFVDYLRQSDSFSLHKTGGAWLSWPALASTFLPYAYGPVAFNFNSKVLDGVWGSIGGYTGLLIIIMAVVGLSSRVGPRGLKIVLVSWIVLCGGRTFGVQPFTALVSHLPLLNRAAFYRYAPPSWILALIILAAFGLDAFSKGRPSRRIPFGVASVLLLICVALAWPMHTFWTWTHGQALVMSAFLGLSLAWALFGLIAMAALWRIPQNEKRRVALASLLVIDAAVMFAIPMMCGTRHNEVDKAAIQFLLDHQGLSRSYTLGPLQPNYGAYFQIANINHNVLPVPKLWADYVDDKLFPGILKGIDGVVFARDAPGYKNGEGAGVFDQRIDEYRQVGVRYLITTSGQSPLPTTSIPSINPSENSAQPFDQPYTPKKLGMGYRMLQWSRSITKNQNSPGVERIVAKAISQAIDPNCTVLPDPQCAGKQGQTLPPLQTLELQNGQSAMVSSSMMADALASKPITSVGVILEQDGNSSQGTLAVVICAGNICGYGQRSLSDAKVNEVFQIPLDKPLSGYGIAPLRLTFTLKDSAQSVAFKLVIAPEETQHLEAPSGTINGRALQLVFEHPMPLPGFHKVYADSIMDVWELPDPAPYYEVTGSGFCRLVNQTREDVTADCSAPARLRRRELYMPGWRVTMNGEDAAVGQDGIFQSALLPAGRSLVRYQFTPPYMGLGWGACAIGMAGLLWQLMRIFRTRQQYLSDPNES